MLRLLLLLTFIMLLSQFPCRAADYTHSEEPLQLADAGQQTTEAMQQSDHKNRLRREQEERDIEKQVAAIGTTQSETRGLDNFVMIVLVVSAGALIFFSSKLRSRSGRRRRPRRSPLR